MENIKYQTEIKPGGILNNRVIILTIIEILQFINNPKISLNPNRIRKITLLKQRGITIVISTHDSFEQ